MFVHAIQINWAAWQENDGLFARVAVNVLARQFFENDLYKWLKMFWLKQI
jgi:hypothetical protein